MDRPNINVVDGRIILTLTIADQASGTAVAAAARAEQAANSVEGVLGEVQGVQSTVENIQSDVLVTQTEINQSLADAGNIVAEAGQEADRAETAANSLSSQISKIDYLNDSRKINLLENGYFEQGTAGWTSIYSSLSVNDGILTATRNTGLNFATTFSAVKEHKYLISFFIATNAGTILIRGGNSSGSVFSIQNFTAGIELTKKTFIVTAKIDSESADFTFAKSGSAVGEFIKLKDVAVVDLTTLFGAGNEPTNATLSDINNVVYRDLVPGNFLELIKVKQSILELNPTDSELQSEVDMIANSLQIGTNLWDNQFYSYIISGGHTVMPSNGSYSVAIPINPNTTYYIEKSNSNRFRVAVLDVPFVAGNSYPDSQLEVILFESDVEGNRAISFKNENGVYLFIQVSTSSEPPEYLYVGTTPSASFYSYFDASLAVPMLAFSKYVSPETIDDITGLSALNSSDIYSDYEELRDNYPYFVSRVLLGNDSLSNPIYSYTFKNGVYANTPKVTITVGIHGNESVGIWSALYFARELCQNPRDNYLIDFISKYVEIVIIPIVNPSGFNANTRANHNGINLNRDFDSANWTYIEGDTAPTPASQIETQLVQNFLKTHDDSILHIDIHNTYVNHQISFYENEPGLIIGQNVERVLSMDMIRRFNAPPGDYLRQIKNYLTGTVVAYSSDLDVESLLIEESRNLPMADNDSDEVTAKCSIELLINTIGMALQLKLHN